MNAFGVLEFVTVFGAGILAGEELVTRYGVAPALAAPSDSASQIRLRQDLIRRLRIPVPAVFGLTALAGAALTVLGGTGPGCVLRFAAMLALLVCMAVTAFGTVPINAAALSWQPEAPPENWRMLVSRWERIDTVRSSAAMLAFALFLADVVRRAL